ncbi:MAG: TRAP transporter substrate-binding protein [Candidatus Anammoxibacter sp.]
MKRIICFSLFFMFSLCLVTNVPNFGVHCVFAEAPVIIKLATLAPDGSTWTNKLRAIDKDLREKSEGRLRLKIYAGGVQGDEKDVVRKMRIGQTHCAGFTGVGLGEILPAVRIFDVPFFLKDYKEVDFIRDKFQDMFVDAFDKKGYIFLGWTEIGFIYFYSNIKITTLDDLRSTKMWMWEGDPLAHALFDAINLSPISLSITDVITSLQTGLIDSIYVSPLGVIALQWFRKVKYVLDVPMADATGAILLTKKKYNTIPPDLQTLLKDVFKVHCAELIEIIRKDNEASVKVLEDSGIIVTSMTDESVKELKAAGETVRTSVVGKLYTAELLRDVTAAIDKFRKSVSN